MFRYRIKLLVRSDDPALAEWTWERTIFTNANSEHEAKRNALQEIYAEGEGCTVVKGLSIKICKPKHKE